ncbi:hypothetical protein V1511DRAFT_495026 [Dipodascopsis uninucleata]
MVAQDIKLSNGHSNGAELLSNGVNGTSKVLQKEDSIAFPFPISEDISSFIGPTYVTPQTLVELVNYALSDAIFSYSPETFDLDTGIVGWKGAEQENGFGVVPLLSQLETRAGAGSLPLGYILSSKLPRKNEYAPRSIIASSGSLPALAPILTEISYLPSVPTPIVLNVAAVDYSPVSGTYVSDYVTALNTAEKASFAVVNSSKAGEIQHMALFASLLSTVQPTVHLYDGVRLARESQRVVDVLSVKRITDTFEKIINTANEQKLHRSEPYSKAGRLLSALNSELGTSYKLFEYEGHDQPEVVLIMLNTVDSAIATETALILSDEGERVGVLSVRVASPFSEAQFLNAIPRSTKRVLVFGQVYSQEQVDDKFYHSSLYEQAFAAMVMSQSFPIEARPGLIDFKHTRESVFTPKHFVWYFDQLLRNVPVVYEIPRAVSLNSFSTVSSFDLLSEKSVSQAVFWTTDDSAFVIAPSKLAQFSSLDSSKNTQFFASFENDTLAGIVESELRHSKLTIDLSYPVTNADVVFVGDEKIFESYNVVSALKYGGTLLINTASKFEDISEKFSSDIKKVLIEKNTVIKTINISAIVDATDKISGSIAFQIAYLTVAFPDSTAETFLGKLASLNLAEDDASISEVSALVEKVQNSITTSALPTTWELKESDEVFLPSFAVADSFAPNEEKFVEEPSMEVETWQTAAKHLAFKEAYNFTTSLRPDLPVTNFIARVKENKRLTPTTYDRNIFHIEFDISGTGLKYDIGEALGVHGQNDRELVDQFIKMYGLDPDAVVLIPSREDPAISEYRTVFQVLLEDVDIFGKIPKKFYESLADFATDEKQKEYLIKLASPAGAEEFKKRADEDMLTYADILEEFDSARPSFEKLIEIVNPLKRREYSIASSQKVHPNAVHLLIVVVDWVDPRGRKRYGQCSRYISMLPVGSEVVVSVKPSVMKLPPLTKQPIIMAGLGTGLAPFKAFVEEKVWQKAQGHEIGEIYLFLGSRHQKEEYLYGEFWEAHKSAGIITHIGAAFSRDQPQKIYIQDRMRECIEDLVPAFVMEQGCYYLCGPTWPVPDVTAVLEDIIAKDAEARGATVDTHKEIEELKEKSRYILEVY